MRHSICLTIEVRVSQTVLNLLDNASVAAFVGAFAAFVLVFATDKRRRYRNRAIVRQLVKSCLDLAQRKLETVQTNLAMVNKDSRITDAPIMTFPIKAMEDYSFQVLDILKVEEKQALDILIYWMSATDGLLAHAATKASEVKTLSTIRELVAELTMAKEEYIRTMQDSERNLQYLAQMLSHYANSEPGKILVFKYKIESE